MTTNTPEPERSAPSAFMDDLRTGTGSVAPRTRAERLAVVIADRIYAAGLAPGAQVGTIEQIRQASGLARATVSEAIRLLHDRGVLTVRPGRGGGLFVAGQSPVVRMRHTLLNARDDGSPLADTVELRDHLEELIDVGAARCRSADDVAELRTRLSAMESAPSWDAFVRAGWALHERIAAVCPNAMARAVYVSTLGELGSSEPRPGSEDDDAHRARRMRVHIDLVDAIASGDEAAVRAAVTAHNTTD